MNVEKKLIFLYKNNQYKPRFFKIKDYLINIYKMNQLKKYEFFLHDIE